MLVVLAISVTRYGAARNESEVVMTFSERVVIFRADVFDCSVSLEGDADKEGPFGEDCADYFSDCFVEVGGSVNDVFSGEEGWYLDLSLNGCLYTLFFHWTPLGDPPEDYWSIQISLRRGFLRSLFGPRPKVEDLEELSQFLVAFLGRPIFSDVKWLSVKELSLLC